jgi:hypothetical protein
MGVSPQVVYEFAWPIKVATQVTLETAAVNVLQDWLQRINAAIAQQLHRQVPRCW